MSVFQALHNSGKQGVAFLVFLFAINSVDNKAAPEQSPFHRVVAGAVSVLCLAAGCEEQREIASVSPRFRLGFALCVDVNRIVKRSARRMGNVRRSVVVTAASRRVASPPEARNITRGSKGAGGSG